MSSTVLCVTDEPPIFSKDLNDELVQLKDKYQVRNVTMNEGIIQLAEFFESEQYLTKHLVVLAFGSCTKLLEIIPQLIGACLIEVKDALTVISIIDIKRIIPVLNSKASSLSLAYYSRSLSCEDFDSYSSINQLIDLSHRSVLNFSILPYGLLYGRNGLHFKNLFRKFFLNDFQGLNVPRSIVLPTIHINDLLKLIFEVIDKAPVSKLPLVIPAFSLENKKFVDVCTELNSIINSSKNGDESAEKMKRTYDYINEIFGFDLSQYNILKLNTCLEKERKIPTLVNPLQIDLIKDWKEVWNDFLSFNGMKPVKFMVAGPPGSGKSFYTQELSKIVQVPIITAQGALQFVASLQPEGSVAQDFDQDVLTLENTLAAMDGAIADDLDKSSIITIRNEILSALETKLSEGVKKGKDKNAPVEPNKINPTLITEAIAYTLDSTVVKKAISLQINFLNACRRRGFVLDLWDRNSIISAGSSLPEINAFINNGDTTASPADFDFILEIQSDDKSLIQRFTSKLEQQNLKPKELQAQVKAYETQLNNYNAQITSEGEVTSHREVVALTNKSPNICVIRRRFDQLDVNEAIQAFKLHAKQTRGEKVAGWIQSSAEDKDETTLINEEKQSSNKTEDSQLISENKNTNEIISAESSSTSAGNQQLAAQRAEKMSTFLSDTILPVITKAFVKIMREKPMDPIEFMANYLAEESAKNQANAYENAKTRFYELLQS